MFLKSICIEVRMNLHCINVFLQFENSLEDSESTLRINVTNEALYLLKNDLETRILLSDHFKINSNSLSGLVVEQHNAAFRLGIVDDNKTHASTSASPTKKHQHVLALALDEETNDTFVELVCGNCKCQLIDKQQFKRLREYPSSGVDLGELFCHNTPKFDDVLVPQLTDCFYGFQFIVLNMQLFKNNTTRQKGEQLYCARCLQHLGETMLSQRAVKLWTDALKLQKTNSLQNEYEDIFTMPTNINNTLVLLMHKIVHECRLPGREMSWLSKAIANLKILLWACMPDGSHQHLMLHVLEQELQVLRHNVLGSEFSELRLEAGTSFKLLYKRPKTTEKDQLLLDSWQQDICIHAMQISPKLYVALFEELQNNALLLPKVYRYANDDEFELSYIFY